MQLCSWCFGHFRQLLLTQPIMALSFKSVTQAASWALVAMVWYIVYQRYNKYLDFFGLNSELSKFALLPTTFEPFIDVPSIDLGSFYNNDKLSQKKTSTEIANASHKYGSFYVSIPNHSTYSKSFRDQLLSNAYRLFNINPKLKQSYRVKSDSSRGFILYGSETGSTEYFEHKEGFSYGYYNWSYSENKIPKNDMESYNVFPPINDNNHIQQSFEQLFDIFIEISYILIKAYSIAIYDDENVLFNEFNGGETISIVRLFHYFSKTHRDYVDKLQEMDTDNYLGSSPHTDWGLLTLIVADDPSGLQLLLNS